MRGVNRSGCELGSEREVRVSVGEEGESKA